MREGGEETICAIASPRGEGAVGVLRISGRDARALLEEASGRKARARRLQRRVLHEPGSGRRIDEVLACWMPGPNSYTGEDVVEVFGHGGEMNMRGLLDLFQRLGAREARPGEFTRRAFLNGRLDLAQAEAVGEIIAAKSARALKNAQAILAGDLGRRVRMFREATIDLAAELEAAIDFVEEVGFGEEAGFGRDRGALLEDLEAIREPLARLIQRTGDAARLEGLSVALVGSVNVGKSSLFNALVDEERALVSEEAGTTRDYLEAVVTWKGVQLRLIDTAGERGEGELTPLEREGRRLAAARVARCDVTLHLVDGSATSEGVSLRRGEDESLFVLTKSDEVDAARRRRWEDAVAKVGVKALWTSAKKREGLTELLDEVVARGIPPEEAGGEETIVVTQRRQVDALGRARDALERARDALVGALAPELCVEPLREALFAFGEVTGESFREDILDAVFSRFCIGK